ncbi:MAG TPA: type IV pilus assembly protein PilM, partial [Nitrospiria bacterium]|nr:type IV pilus assembly protein PilM [Nitrospiria bacterium]
GIDLGRSSIKLVQLRSTRTGFRLIYAGLTELPVIGSPLTDPAISLALMDLLQKGRLKSEKAAVNFIGNTPVIRYITLPKIPKEELKEAVKWEAKKIVPLPIEEMVLDFLTVGEQEDREVKRLELVVVAAERSEVLAQYNELKRIGLNVAAVDVNPLALLNAVCLNHAADLNDNIVFVDIGGGKTDINITKQGVLRFTRNVQIGGEEITKAIERELHVGREEAETMKRQRGMLSKGAGTDIPDADGRLKDVIQREADRIILETQRSIDYYRAQFREGEIKKIILMGGTPLLPGFQDYFSAYFGTKVAMDDPFAEIDCDESSFAEFRIMAPRFSTSVGLALRKGDV